MFIFDVDIKLQLKDIIFFRDEKDHIDYLLTDFINANSPNMRLRYENTKKLTG